jgi:hypothetical protein
MFDILSIQRNANQNYIEISSHFSRNGYHQENNKCWWGWEMRTVQRWWWKKVFTKEGAVFFPKDCAWRHHLYALPQSIPNKSFDAKSNPIQVKNPGSKPKDHPDKGEGKERKIIGSIKRELPKHFSGSTSFWVLLLTLKQPFCFIIKTFFVLLLSGLLS